MEEEEFTKGSSLPGCLKSRGGPCPLGGAWCPAERSWDQAEEEDCQGNSHFPWFPCNSSLWSSIFSHEETEVWAVGGSTDVTHSVVKPVNGIPSPNVTGTHLTSWGSKENTGASLFVHFQDSRHSRGKKFGGKIAKQLSIKIPWRWDLLGSGLVSLEKRLRMSLFDTTKII